jgi:hypothetical protein
VTQNVLDFAPVADTVESPTMPMFGRHPHHLERKAWSAAFFRSSSVAKPDTGERARAILPLSQTTITRRSNSQNPLLSLDKEDIFTSPG